MARSVLGQLSSTKRRGGLPWPAALVLLLGALLVNGVGLYGTGTALALALEPVPKSEPDEEVVEFDLVDPDDTRFIDQDRANDRAPNDTRHLAEADSDVEHQTQAPLQPSQPTVATKPSTDPRENPEPPKGERDGETRDGESEGQQQGAGDDSLAHADDGASASEGADASKGQPNRLTTIGGSPSVLEQTFGRPGADDRLVDVDEGAENVLDSKRHVYASFFNRIRDQIADQWRPNRAHQLADPNGTKYGNKQRTTVLMVRLDANGDIVKVVIIQDSGAPHLDAEAVRAMKAAAPFPNPPEGLADSKGHIDFQFGFILDFVEGPRLFRVR